MAMAMAALLLAALSVVGLAAAPACTAGDALASLAPPPSCRRITKHSGAAGGDESITSAWRMAVATAGSQHAAALAGLTRALAGKGLAAPRVADAGRRRWSTWCDPASMKTDDGTHTTATPPAIKWTETAGILPPPAPVATGSLRFFSFFDFYMVPHYTAYYNTSFEEISTWLSTPSFTPDNGSIAFANQLWAAGHKMQPLWKVADTQIWTYPCSKVECGSVAMDGLVEDWEEIVDDMVATIKQQMPDYAARTAGFDLGDELLAEGTPLANVTAVARRIREQFASGGGGHVFVYLNENSYAFSPGPTPNLTCFGGTRCAAAAGLAGVGCCLNGPDGVPPEIDAISIDLYADILQPATGLPDPNSTCPHPVLEADCVFKFLKSRVFPHLHHPTQKVFVVPGLYGDDDMLARADTDTMLTSKFNRFWELAVKEPLVVGIKPWHFINEKKVPSNATNAKFTNQFHLGATSYPTLMKTLQQKGRALKAKVGPHNSSKDRVRSVDSSASRLLVFTDRTLFSDFDSRLEQRMNPPTKGPLVVTATEPWESNSIGAWVHVLQMPGPGNEMRMYYGCLEHAAQTNGRPCAPGKYCGDSGRICLATSTNGIDWVKPHLGIFDRNGSTANNILLADSGVSVFFDQNPRAPAAAKWKMTCSAAVYGSPDGLRFTRLGTNGSVPVHTMDDTKPTGNWDPVLERYVIFTRRDDAGANMRHISRCVTRDFTDWDADYAGLGCPTVFGSDSNDPQAGTGGIVDVYSNSWTPYPSMANPAVHLFFPSMFFHFDWDAGSQEPFGFFNDGLLDTRLLVSRDAATLDYTTARNARAPFVPLGVNTCGKSTPSVPGGWCDPASAAESRTSADTSAMWMASGFLPSNDGLEIFLYLHVQPNTHGDYKRQSGNNSGIRLMRLRKDGFVSVEAPYLFKHDLRLLPSFTTVELIVPSGCGAPTTKTLPVLPRVNVGCSYGVLGGCNAARDEPGWHNVSCESEADCSKLCGQCHCAGKAATCKHGFCQTGDLGGMICNNTLPPDPTKALVGGAQLMLNVETGVAGFVAVEVLLQGGKAAEGMELEASDPIKGSAINAVASWGKGQLATLAGLAGQSVKLRVTMADAKLFSMQLACCETQSAMLKTDDE